MLSPSPKSPKERTHLWNKTLKEITLTSQLFGVLEKQELSQNANLTVDVRTSKGQKYI